MARPSSDWEFELFKDIREVRTFTQEALSSRGKEAKVGEEALLLVAEASEEMLQLLTSKCTDLKDARAASSRNKSISRKDLLTALYCSSEYASTRTFESLPFYDS